MLTDNNYTEEIQNNQAAKVEVKADMLTYIRAMNTDEGEGFAICSDQGKVLAQFTNFNAAYYTAKQFHLTPLRVH